MSENTNNALMIMLFISLILASFTHVQAQPAIMSGIEVTAKPGICPNY
jgi:hypothetical protein